MADNNLRTRLRGFLNLFNLGINPTGTSNASKVVFTSKATDSKGVTGSVADKLSPSARNTFDWWENSVYFNKQKYENRIKLYEDMDRAFFNSSIIGRSVKMTASEIVQADSNNVPIGIEANRKTRKFIQNFFDDIGLYYKIYPLAEDIVQYGNAGWLLGFGNKGVSEVIHVDVYDIVERLEFNAKKIQKEVQQRSGIIGQLQQHDRIGSLIKSISDSENFESDFKSYLLGFQISDKVVPPWRFLHFRNYTSKGPFDPFGMPFFINSLSSYRQYDAGLSLQVAARGARFPIDVYKLQGLEGDINPTTKIERMMEFINQLDNSGMRGIQKEGIGIGERMITADGVFTFEQITPQIDIGKIDDLDLLKEDLIESTGIPINFFIAGKDGFGSSAQSLAQQDRNYARLVYRGQSIILEQMSQLVKIHMIQSGQFSIADMEFSLTMPYPESQTNPEIITSQNELLGLANNVLDSLADKLFGGSAADLPYEVKKAVYHQILPYDQSRIDSWMDTIEKDREKMNKDIANQVKDLDSKNLQDLSSFGGASANHVSPVRLENVKAYKKMIESTGNTLFSEILKEEIYKEKSEFFREGSYGGKHYFSSKNKPDKFHAEQLVEYDKKRMELLEKSEKGKVVNIPTYFKEEVVLPEYKFMSSSKEDRGEKIRGEYLESMKKWSGIKEEKEEIVSDKNGQK